MEGRGEGEGHENEPEEGTGPESPQPPETPAAPLWSAPANAEPPPPPPGPQSPAPGPQSPGPQSPGPQSPGTQPPPPPPPTGPQAPPPASPGYGGPVPPGGWQQPAKPALVLQGELASWGSRLGAYLLDWLIVIVVLFVGGLIIVGAAAGSEVAGIVVGILLGLVMLAVLLGYWSFLTARKGAHNGQTFGKQAVGIRVVRDDGHPMDAGSSLLRELVLQGLALHVASSIIPFIPWFLNYFWPLWDDSDRALHDMVCKTHVLRT